MHGGQAVKPQLRYQKRREQQLRIIQIKIIQDSEYNIEVSYAKEVCANDDVVVSASAVPGVC